MNPGDQYDVVVVGGGIHGAGVAQAAAAHGHSVMLLEQTAIAAGTSSRSSKLIHGGLRYLETFQFGLVRESLQERRLLQTLAPDLVRLVSFHIPVYTSTRRRPWLIRTGLGLYALLGGLNDDNRFSVVPHSQWERLDGIDTHGLQTVFRYYDGQTDDATLTCAVLRSAQSLGAELVLPGRFIQARLESGGVTVDFETGNTRHSCFARTLVNAAGPWVNRVLAGVVPQQPLLDIDLVRGSHLRVAGSLHAGNYYLEAPQDGRAVFVMPREGSVLVGTTEAIYLGDPADVIATEQDQGYLVDVLAHYFPQYRRREDIKILSSYAGLRVLPRGEGRVFKRSRETLFRVDSQPRPRVLSVYGGKLTTYRATAEKVLARLHDSLPVRSVQGSTRQLPLSAD